MFATGGTVQVYNGLCLRMWKSSRLTGRVWRHQPRARQTPSRRSAASGGGRPPRWVLSGANFRALGRAAWPFRVMILPLCPYPRPPAACPPCSPSLFLRSSPQNRPSDGKNSGSKASCCIISIRVPVDHLGNPGKDAPHVTDSPPPACSRIPTPGTPRYLGNEGSALEGREPARRRAGRGRVWATAPRRGWGRAEGGVRAVASGRRQVAAGRATW